LNWLHHGAVELICQKFTYIKYIEFNPVPGVILFQGGPAAGADGYYGVIFFKDCPVPFHKVLNNVELPGPYHGGSAAYLALRDIHIEPLLLQDPEKCVSNLWHPVIHKASCEEPYTGPWLCLH